MYIYIYIISVYIQYNYLVLELNAISFRIAIDTWRLITHVFRWSCNTSNFKKLTLTK